MEVSKYILLFHKKLKGVINPEEQKELSDWLEQESRHGFAEEMEKAWGLSQRYKEGYEPDVDAGLARLQKRIASSRQAGEGAVVADLPRRRRPFRWMSIAAAIALLAAAGWWWFNSGNAATGDNTLFYTTGPGEKEEVALPDGSVVVLNENSLLQLNEGLRNPAERRAELTGEAYFVVEPDASRPFRISTPDALVEVLGTAFNLRSYPGEGFTEVEVEEGNVRFSGPERKNTIEVTPGQRGVCRPGQPMQLQEEPGLNAHSWRTRRLQFRNTPLSEALAFLERHFKIELQLDNRQLAGCAISMEFENFTLPEVLEALQLIFKVQVHKMEGGYRLDGGGCKPATPEMR